MEVMKVIIIVAVTMALSITITMKGINQVEEKPTFHHSEAEVSLSSEGLAVHDEDNKFIMPSKRLSRFLDETYKNPRSSDHCYKDDEKCKYLGHYGNYTACCNNKCLDLSYDNNNCGACKRKCKYTQACCRGECVYLSLDKRHCGACNNRCPRGEFCVYGLCNYP